MATRNDYLNTIKTFDTPTLEKLIGFVNTVLIPDQNALVKVTFTDMVDEAHTLAATYFPTWTDQSKADFGEFLVELFALFSWKDFWYINAFGQEAFMQNAKSYVSVVLHALRLGYIPAYAHSSAATFAITFTGVPAPLTLLPGQIEISYPGTGLIFTLGQNLAVAPGTNTLNVSLVSGRYATNNQSFNGKSIRIPAVNVDPASIGLTINDVPWTQVTSFADATDVTTAFMVLPTDGNQFEIVFGLYGFGLRPSVGDSCSVVYRVDNTQPNNVPQSASTTIQTDISGFITAAAMSTDATGGSLPEVIESIRQRSSLLYRTNNTKSIINPQDAVIVLESFGTIAKATAFNLGRNLFFAVIPSSGVPADTAFMDNVANAIANANTIMGFSLMPSLTSYVTITDITLTYFLYNEFDPVDIGQQIKDYFSYITDPLQGAAYGVGIDLGLAVEELVSTIEGLNNVVFTTLNGVSAANIVLSGLQIFNAINQGIITLNAVKTT